jgi:hypothetical protein
MYVCMYVCKYIIYVKNDGGDMNWEEYNNTIIDCWNEEEEKKNVDAVIL